MSEKITSLTPEQEALIPQYVERFKKIGLSTSPTNREAAEQAIKDSYASVKMPEPKIYWAVSPFAGAKLAAQLAKGSEDQPDVTSVHDIEVTKEEIAAQASKASYGSLEACWVCFYAFITEQLPVEHDGLINIVLRIVQECGVYWTFEDCVVLTEKPTKILVKGDVLHSEDGKALEYADGTGVVAVNGQRYPSLLEAALAAKADNLRTEKDIA